MVPCAASVVGDVVFGESMGPGVEKFEVVAVGTLSGDEVGEEFPMLEGDDDGAFPDDVRGLSVNANDAVAEEFVGPLVVSGGSVVDDIGVIDPS